VTGASSGIGEAAAKALAAQGAKVVLAARRKEELDRVAAEIAGAGGEALAVRTDATVDEDVAAAVRTAEEQFGGLDIAFNNAGAGGTVAPVFELTPQAWRDDIESFLTSVFIAIRHETPALLRRGGGVIINNGSVVSLIGSPGRISSYVAAKHGVLGLTRAAALELAPQNVRVNAIALGSIDTPGFRGMVSGHEELAEQFRAAHPLGRIARPEEPASLVAYLAGDDAAFITGAVISMDGGWTAQ
jgi:NAD(P)-dependent dehydrogenase (short-subunit alcohol dehydrogenase family)